MRTSLAALALVALSVFSRTFADTISTSPNAGYMLSWTGTNGPAVPPADGNGANVVNNFPVNNAADIALGATPFASSQLAPVVAIHQTVHINDGFYGNSNSWISASGDPAPYIGLSFNGPIDMTGFGWSRDNAQETAGACTGPCTDRWAGTYTIERTLVPHPGTGTTFTGNAATGWETVGTVTLAGGPGSAIGYLLHDYTTTFNGGNLDLTGLRIMVPDAFGAGATGGTDVDELLVFGHTVPEPSTFVLSGLALVGLLVARRRRK